MLTAEASECTQHPGTKRHRGTVEAYGITEKTLTKHKFLNFSRQKPLKMEAPWEQTASRGTGEANGTLSSRSRHHWWVTSHFSRFSRFPVKIFEFLPPKTVKNGGTAGANGTGTTKQTEPPWRYGEVTQLRLYTCLVHSWNFLTLENIFNHWSLKHIV